MKTVKTIGHLGSAGILELPDRQYNIYKQCTIRHFVGLIQIRRLAELGVPLSRVVVVFGRLQLLYTRAWAEIEHLFRVGSDIAALASDHALNDIPRGFERLALNLVATVGQAGKRELGDLA